MKLIIHINDNKVLISLKNERKIVSEAGFALENNMTEKLLPEIDEILKKNNLKPKDIEKAIFRTNMKNSYTTVRIGKAVANTFNWAKDKI